MDSLRSEEVRHVFAVAVQELQPVGMIWLNRLADIDKPVKNILTIFSHHIR